VIHANVTVPSAQRTKLVLEVSHHVNPDSDWQMVVKANGKTLRNEIVGPKLMGTDGWAKLEIDLSDYAGQTVALELLNLANDWRWEFGFWDRIEIVSTPDTVPKLAAVKKVATGKTQKSAAIERGVSASIPVGSVWVGLRHFANSSNEQRCELRIRTSEKSLFAGELTLWNPEKTQNTPFTVKLKGKLNGEDVSFQSETKEQFQQNFVGKLRGDRMALEFSGVNKNGRAASGTAVLTMKPMKPADIPGGTKERLEEIAHVPIRPFHNPIAFSADSKRVAIDNFWNIKLVELETGKVLRDIAPGRPIVGNFNCVMSIAIAPDGKIVASYEDQMIRVWDPSGSQKIRDLGTGPQGERITGLAYSKLQDCIIGRGHTEVRSWSLEKGSLLKSYPQPNPLLSLAVSPSGKYFATLDRKTGVNLWTASGERVGNIPDSTKKVNRIRFTAEGHLLCLAPGIPEFSLIDPVAVAPIAKFEGPVVNVVDATVFEKGRLAAAIYADNTLRIWNVSSARVVYEKACEGELRRVGISPDDRYMVLIFKDHAILYRIN
jgi:WD40 repeat protein